MRLTVIHLRLKHRLDLRAQRNAEYESMRRNQFALYRALAGKTLSGSSLAWR